MWQSVVLSDYLPRIVGKDMAAAVYGLLKAKAFAKLKVYPLENPATKRYVVRMPHEFAIAFRFGHSQLRSEYQLQPGKPAIPLFINQTPPMEVPADLRGGRDLQADHVIDWNFFLGRTGAPAPGTISNEIDTEVTAAVFDLPESAIPDDIKYIGNLPQRNLIRSRQLGLTSGQELAVFFGVPPLKPNQVESDMTKQALFKGPTGTGTFRTPLSYYVLKEAELAAETTGPGSGFLGALGGRLVAEVVGGAVFWAGDLIAGSAVRAAPVASGGVLRCRRAVRPTGAPDGSPAKVAPAAGPVGRPVATAC